MDPLNSTTATRQRYLQIN